MLIPGREWQEGYRFAFNGKEQDSEQIGQGNIYDYGFRIYNPRLGKFLSVDPLTRNYPWYTPFQFAGNKPIAAIDIDGLEDSIVITAEYYSDSKIVNTKIIRMKLFEQGPHGNGNTFARAQFWHNCETDKIDIAITSEYFELNLNNEYLDNYH